MWTKFGSKLQKFLKCGRTGGGGSSVISDTPGRGGGGGVKKGQIFADVLYGWPLSNFKSNASLSNSAYEILSIFEDEYKSMPASHSPMFRSGRKLLNCYELGPIIINEITQCK